MLHPFRFPFFSLQVHAGTDRNAGLPAIHLLLLHLEVHLSPLHGCANDSQHHPAGSQPAGLQRLDQRGGEYMNARSGLLLSPLHHRPNPEVLTQLSLGPYLPHGTSACIMPG